MTDLFAPLTPPNPAAVRPTCRRHRWEAQQCVRCGAHWDAIAARRGRLNRSRGNAGQVAILVLATAPGPGVKRRGVVIIDLDDWADLHGPETGA